MEKEIRKRIDHLLLKLQDPRGNFEAMDGRVNDGYEIGVKAQIESEIGFLRGLLKLAGFIRSIERV